MKPRIVYIHGNGAQHWSYGWAKWLKTELDKHGYKTFFETFPDSVIARAEYWLPFLKNHIKAGTNDVLVGYSSGGVAAMRYAEVNRIKGSVLISPCYTDLDDELEKQSGYYDDPWQWEKIKANQDKIGLIYGDDDPFIPQAEFKHISEKLNAETIKIHGAKHFIEQKTFPQLLQFMNVHYVS